jgi:hypothetical protein
MAEHFNDWDLQAVVRSCGSVAHPEPAAAAPRADQPDAAPEPVPAPRRDEAPAARATPTTVPVRRQGRASPPAAKAAALLYDLEYLDLDHRPFLLPAAPSPSPSPGPRAGGGGREGEVMISFPAAAAASTSGTQQRASPSGRKPGARTPRHKRRYRTGRPVQHRTVVEPAEEGGAMMAYCFSLLFFSSLVVVWQQEEPAEEGGAGDAGGRRRLVVVGPVGVAQVWPKAHQGLALSAVTTFDLALTCFPRVALTACY